MDRRDFLRAALAAAGTPGLAGCLGDDGPGAGGGTPTDGTPMAGATTTEGDDATTSSDAMAGTTTTETRSTDDGTAAGGSTPEDTATSTPAVQLGGHPAANGILAQPWQGPRPGEATGTIVAFEDPSCPRCRVFEQETVPKIRSRLVEPGDATFVFRGYPVQPYPWGEPAAQALEATFARAEPAHWALAEHYFAEQDAFTDDNVLDRTRQFLADETGVDGAAVVADVEDDAFQDRVDLDLRVGRAAGAGGVTPTVFLFRDGEFQTKARGSVSFTLVKNALGL